MWPKALLLGDSQTQLAGAAGGWAQLLADKFVRRLDIVNRGFSGYNTRMLLTILPDILSQESREDVGKIEIVVIFLGSNDASIASKNPEQAVPLEEFGENLLKIVSVLLSKGVKRDRLVIVSPPPVLPEKWTRHRNLGPGPRYENCKDNQLTRTYAEECCLLARRHNLTYVDLFTSLMDFPNLDAALSDGLHLASDGNAVLYQMLSPEFDKILESGVKFPEWREMDNEDPAGSYTNWKIINQDRM